MSYFNFLDGGERSPTNVSYYNNSPFGLYSSGISSFKINNKTKYFFNMTGFYWNPPLLSSSTIYLGIFLQTGSLGNTLSFNNINGNAQIYLKFNTNGTISVTSGSNVLGTSAKLYTISSNIAIYIEVYLVVSASSGAVSVRLNGNPTAIINLTGVNTANDTTSLPIIGISSNSNSSYFRDVYIIDGTGSAPYNTFLGCVGCNYLPPMANSSISFTAIPLPPTNLSPTVVQSKTQVFSGDPSITLSSATTVGNWLVALALFSTNSGTNTGWSQQGGTTSASNWNIKILYQQVTTSSTGPFVPLSSGSNGCCIALYEISGAGSSWDVDASFQSQVSTSGTLITAPFTPTTTGELELILVSTNSGASVIPVLDSSFTTDTSISPTNGGSAGTVTAVSGHKNLGTLGVSNSATITSYSGVVYIAGITFLKTTYTAIPNYANAARTPPVSGYYNQNSTINALDSFSLTSLPSNASSILGLKLFDYSYRNHSGSRALAKIITSGTSTATGTVQYLNETPVVTEDLYTVNPITSGSWSTTLVNALIAGYKVIA
jgi:hypothetical protein